MAANTSKDQPPIYDQASTTGSSAELPTTIALKPYHSTRASTLSHATSQGTYTTVQYLELTFSIMVFCCGTREPVVLAIDEHYDSLLHDIQHIFVKAGTAENEKVIKNAKKMTHMTVSWGIGGTTGKPYHDPSFEVNRNNITAMLRLLKSRNGVDFLEVR